MDHTRGARAIADRCAAELAPRTRGVAVTGSVATGTDHPDSDIDLIALTDTSREVAIRSVEGRMVTTTWTSPDRIRAAFTDPWQAGAAVPGWRAAVILADPDGALADIVREAEAWTWEAVGADADRCAAEAVVGLAEEVHKVCGMLAAGRIRAAAANRGILTLRLPGALALSHRLLYGTENDLWDLVCDAEGPAWADAWDTAAGAGGGDGCRAALRLYLLAAARVEAHLDPGARAVVDVACALARRTGG